MTERELIGMGPWLKFIWNGHITNWLWRERKKRRIVRDLAFGEYKMSYLKKYIPFVKSLKASDFSTEADPSLLQEQDKKVGGDDYAYTLWLQGFEQAPDIVKKCIGSMKKEFGEKFILFTEENIWKVISLPSYIIRKREEKKIGAAHIADLIRIELLYKYGGYWFDATDFLTGTPPEFIKEAPFFMYMGSKTFLPYMFVQNCFIRSKQGDPLMGMWRKLVHEYWRHEDMACEYFLVQMLFRLLVTYNEEAKILFSRMPKVPMDVTHVLWHEIGDKPFNKEGYEIMCGNSFFQKCSYRKMRYGIGEILPGSFAERVLNGNIE